MRGTEKQISWAEDLQNKALNAFEAAKNAFAMQKQQAGVDECERYIKNISEADYAGDIIGVFKDAKLTGDAAKDFGSIMQQIAFNANYTHFADYTDGMKKIVMADAWMQRVAK